MKNFHCSCVVLVWTGVRLALLWPGTDDCSLWARTFRRSGSQDLPPEEQAACAALEKHRREIMDARKVYTSAVRKRRQPDDPPVNFGESKRNRFQVAVDVVKDCCNSRCLRKHCLLASVQSLRENFWQLPQAQRQEHITQVLRESFDSGNDKQLYYLCKVSSFVF